MGETTKVLKEILGFIAAGLIFPFFLIFSTLKALILRVIKKIK